MIVASDYIIGFYITIPGDTENLIAIEIKDRNCIVLRLTLPSGNRLKTLIPIGGARSPQRPTQAVILAGGRGTRLKPLTDTRPKPMVEIHGKPFLAYQIEQLRDQGFEKVLLLLGYLPQVVQDYFGDGSRWGIKIEYSISAVDDETARRLKLAESLLGSLFPLALLRQLLAHANRQNVAAIHRQRRAGDDYGIHEQRRLHAQ